MNGQPIAILMARESTRRHLTEPREPRPRTPRRAAARRRMTAEFGLRGTRARKPESSSPVETFC